MSPNDIKRIVNCVVDYGWPWQFPRNQNQGNGEYYWTTHHEQDVRNLCRQIGYGFEIRLDPTHEWTWDIEARWNKPCWVRWYYIDGYTAWNHGFVHELTIYAVRGPDVYAGPIETFWDARKLKDGTIQSVGIHPLNPTMEPPAEWSPEGKRILK